MLRSTGRMALLLALLIASGFTPLLAQSVLTPEQLTVRVKRVGDISERNEAALKTVQQQMRDLIEEMARLGRLIDNRAVLDMIQQVDDLAQEISMLRGEIEIQGNDIGEIKQRQRELYLDIDRRLRDLESRATSPAPGASISVPQINTTAPIKPAGTSSQQIPAVEPALPATTTTPSTTASISQTPSVTQSEERDAYQAAFDTLKEGRYKQAKTELRTFLDRYPNSSFAGNAQYWLGEAHYVTRNFEQGITEFESVLSRYPSSNKVPDAMLKLGYTFYELKQFEQAKTILQDLRERFPKATAARLAAKRLDRIRKEGH